MSSAHDIQDDGYQSTSSSTLFGQSIPLPSYTKQHSEILDNHDSHDAKPTHKKPHDPSPSLPSSSSSSSKKKTIYHPDIVGSKAFPNSSRTPDSSPDRRLLTSNKNLYSSSGSGSDSGTNNSNNNNNKKMKNIISTSSDNSSNNNNNNDDDDENLFMSEPSLTEDAGTTTTVGSPTSKRQNTNQLNVVVGEDIDILRRSSSNTSLSSLGSPSITISKRKVAIVSSSSTSQNELISKQKNTSTGTASGNKRLLVPSLPTLTDVVDDQSKEISSGGNADEIHDKAAITQVDKILKSTTEMSQNENIDNTRTKLHVYISPRLQSNYDWADSKSHDDSKESAHIVTSSTEPNQKSSSSEVHGQSSVKYNQEVGRVINNESLCIPPLQDDTDNISIGESLQNNDNINQRTSEEEYNLESPPKIEKTLDLSSSNKNVASPFKIEQNKNFGSDENDSVTPRRKTSRSDSGPEDNLLDDERKPRAQRKRINSDGKRAPKHRRKKSGDEAAVKMFTGSAEWIGMELDQLPLPSQNEEEEEEDEEDVQNDNSEDLKVNPNSSFSTIRTEERSNRRKGRHGSKDQLLPQHSTTGDLTTSTSDLGVMPAHEFSKYARSSGDVEQGINYPSVYTYEASDYNSDNKSETKYESNQVPLGDASVSSVGSQGTAFSWISNRVSLLSNRDDIRSIGNTLESTPQRDLGYHSPIPEDAGASNTSGTNSYRIQDHHRKNMAVYDDIEMKLGHLSENLLQPELEVNDPKKTFTCPRCGKKQRRFFTATSVPESLENPINFMVAYFVVYVMLALFIFGIEEGWPTLDCVYFAVMTLTTTGLGDYVPTNNGAKIVCSIFMYFGVACVGLLLGLLHANSLDQASKKSAEENLISNCVYCNGHKNVPKGNGNTVRSFSSSMSPRRRRRMMAEQNVLSSEEIPFLDSPVRRSALHTIDEKKHIPRGIFGSEVNRDDEQSVASSQISTISLDDDFKPVTQIKAAKYIFLTLKQAFANTLFIIGIGSVGFMYLEQMTTVDSFYFTTSLLTTVGYGDLVPETTLGKLFASIFEIIAWICLLYNISMISMIPLELRKRRVDHAVLSQFGDELDNTTFNELVSGSLVRRLSGKPNNSLEESNHCTREMFALTMLVRLGKVNEQDIRATFAAFQKLDRNNDGILTKNSYIPSTNRDLKSFLPRLRNTPFPTLSNENSALLHPLAEKDETDIDQRDYMTVPRFKDRGFSLESISSNITDEHWDDHH